jgi:hypothetical protein
MNRFAKGDRVRLVGCGNPLDLGRIGIIHRKSSAGAMLWEVNFDDGFRYHIMDMNIEGPLGPETSVTSEPVNTEADRVSGIIFDDRDPRPVMEGMPSLAAEVASLKHRLTALEATCVRKMATKEDVVAGKASGDRAADARARRADEIRAEYRISFVYRDGRRDALRVTCRGVYLAEFPYLGEERIPPDNMAERFIAAEVDHRLREEAHHG